MIIEELIAEGLSRREGRSLPGAAPIGLDIGAETPEEIARGDSRGVIAVRRKFRSLSLGSTRIGNEGALT